MTPHAALYGAAVLFALGCGSDAKIRTDPATCAIVPGSDVPDDVERLSCRSDFDALASEPLDGTIPGARSLKVVLDQEDPAQSNALYFQNSQKFRIHWDFASTHLSGGGRPLVEPRAEFEATEYFKSTRRFLLGAVTYYEGPQVWALELAPYDTASASMIETLYDAVKANAYFGPDLRFHPTSTSLSAVSEALRGSIPITTTDELFAKTDYQPLNLATACGQLRFMTADALETEYVGFRDIVVLDHVPNDISVVAGMITEDFQTPLSHVNVLAQNRGTPNMGLRGATTNPELASLEGQWVKLTVGASTFTIEEVGKDEADQYWEAHRPPPVDLPAIDTGTTDLRDVRDLVDETDGGSLRDEIETAIRSFGTKATNYGVLANTPNVPVRPAFAIPFSYYVQFMTENGFYDRVEELLADEEFQNSAAVRDQRLAELRDAIVAAPVDASFQALLRAKIDADFPGVTLRVRTSTNAEDLDGFPCAGCYESHTGDPADWEGDLLPAIKQAWAGVWFFRTFEERTYHGIDHEKVGMALLVHHNFPHEEANGVAATANPFDASGSEPAFYVNVQWGGDAEVVHPPPNVTSDEFIYFWEQANSTVDYLGHSNLIAENTTVLDGEQLIELGTALEAIHHRFLPAYGPGVGTSSWYAMDVEFKFDDEDQADGKAHLWVKQARPYPGRGQ